MEYANYCGQWCMVRVPLDEQPVMVVRWFCGSWECQKCGQRKATKWYLVTLAGHRAAPEDTKFVTLTTDYGREEDAATAWAEQGKRWNRFAVTLRKMHAPDLEYIRVLETTKAGYPHVHALMRMPFIKQATLSRYAAQAGFGRVCYITRPRNDEHAGRYVVKYLYKAVAHPIPQPTRRISMSARWPPRDWVRRPHVPDPDGVWMLDKHTVEEAVKRLTAAGAKVAVRDYAAMAREETAVASGE